MGAMGAEFAMPESIQRVLAVEPIPGSTFLDAEHIIFLMQENRSFDHSFGSLNGVRGFSDPRAIKLPNGNPVWLQSDKKGNTYAPFRLDIKRSKAAWTSYLPHSWENQSAARNNGKHDNWLEAKRSGYKSYQDIPLTLGYYTREDIPFYYAMADAFTICDQHFCSSITGTTTNRHFFWTGTCVPEKGAKPLVRNSDTYFNKWAQWRTFPELLEREGISWKIYQNELSLQSGLEDSSLLGNFTDNNLEWFTQYHVEYKPSHLAFLKKRLAELPAEIESLTTEIAASSAANSQKLQQTLKQKIAQNASFEQKLKALDKASFEALPAQEKALFQKAFQTNEGDPYYREASNVREGASEIRVPKGDILHQFREDVTHGSLPTVSWLVAPEAFTDHPSAPMYGSWYVSEILKILADNPEVWKKTIFVLNYDENDGYFDHIPPFVAPNPADPSSGRVSPSLDITGEYVSMAQELEAGVAASEATEGPVGLGYRVPLIIASPWTRGGWVNSEVCDITSTIQLLEYFIEKKFHKSVVETNISSWRRAITGNLTSVFRKADASPISSLPFLARNTQIAAINEAKNKPLPNDFKAWLAADMEQLQKTKKHPFLPKQEPQRRASNALAYELYVTDSLQLAQGKVQLKMRAGMHFFGNNSLNAPFNIYAGASYQKERSFWPFAVVKQEDVTFDWALSDFKDGIYDLTAYGPNGYMRGFKGKDEEITVDALYETGKSGLPTGDILLRLQNRGEEDARLLVKSNAYEVFEHIIALQVGETKELRFHATKYGGWYDLSVYIPGKPFQRDYAGRVETGKASYSDPQLSYLDAQLS